MGRFMNRLVGDPSSRTSHASPQSRDRKEHGHYELDHGDRTHPLPKIVSPGERTNAGSKFVGGHKGPEKKLPARREKPDEASDGEEADRYDDRNTGPDLDEGHHRSPGTGSSRIGQRSPTNPTD